MKKILYVIIFLFFAGIAYCQNKQVSKAFDSIYYDVAVNISSDNPRRALQIADSLYLYSDLKLQKSRGLMLKADIVEKQGRHEEAIEYALKGLEIAEEIENYLWQAKIYGFLSSQYRNIGFLDQGKLYLKKGIDISTKIENKKLASQFRGMAYQEMAYCSLEELKYEEALNYVEMAAPSFYRIQDEQQRYFFIGNNQEMFGRCYSGLKQYKKAKEHYHESLKNLEKIVADQSQWAGMSYQGLGEIYLMQNKLDSARFYLYKALPIIEKTDHALLTEELYKTLSAYYKVEKNLDSFVFYDTKYRAALEENISNDKNSANREFNRVIKNSSSTSNESFYYWLGIGCVVLLMLLIIFKDKIAFKKNVSEKDVEEQKKPSSLVIPQETEDDLLQKLNEFEASHDYLDKNMSFSFLVGRLGTNAKYLSYLLKNYKNKDYNTYVNELRIQYIIEKLKTDPNYLNYKISYLADECGFSSHSKFSANFKRVVKLSPSEYINSLRD